MTATIAPPPPPNGTTANTSTKPAPGILATAGAWLAFAASNLYYMDMPLNALVRPTWRVAEMPSQAGKTVLITGANSGTGYATAKAYYDAGARVLLACRSAGRAAQAMEDIRAAGEMDMTGRMVYPASTESSGELVFVPLDLADLASVEAAAGIIAGEKRLDVVFANAGVMHLPPGSTTRQGYSLQFGTNVLGHQRLISLLLPILQRTTAAHPSSPGRIVVVASAAHILAPPGGIPYPRICGGKPLGAWEEYACSKWGNIALGLYLDKHYGPCSGSRHPVDTIIVHPGLVRTNLWTHLSAAGFLLARMAWLVPLMNVTAATGALNQIWAGQVDAELGAEMSGKYVVPYQVIASPRPDLRDESKWEELWEWCEEQAKRVE